MTTTIQWDQYQIDPADEFPPPTPQFWFPLASYQLYNNKNQKAYISFFSC